MTTAEIFSWCACLAIGALSWLAAGIPGTLCLIVGMIISQIDVGWIEHQLEEKEPEATSTPAPPAPSAPSAPKPPKTKMRRKKARASSNVIPFPTQRVS